MKTGFSIMACCLLALGALTACKGSESGSGGGGAGGSASTTTTNTATGTGCDACWPQCFLDMFAPCTPSGTCVKQSAGTTVNNCYENGVKATAGVGTTGATLSYYKADGSVCFTSESAFSATAVTATYKDASGNVLLTDTAPIAGGPQTIECGGKTYTVDPESAACKSCQTGGSSSDCTAGTCTVP